jgi:hypothetical protein
LIWRGSRDGFGARTFHQLCDNKKNTLLLVKSSNNSVFGGYTSVAWQSPEAERTEADNSAFIFSLKNKNNDPKILKVKQDDYQESQVLQDAVYHSTSCGPTFGLHFTGRDPQSNACFRHDLTIQDFSNEEETSHIEIRQYENLENLTSSFITGGVGIFFKTEDVEVFEIF